MSITPAFLYPKDRSSWKRVWIATAVLLLAFIAIAHFQRPAISSSISHLHSVVSSKLHSTADVKHSGVETAHSFVKPEDLKLVAIVFFGRIDRISILNCYLRRNLVATGGWLDEVIFVVNRHTDASMKWLNETVAATPGYTIWGGCMDCGFSRAWDIVEDGVMYIKIDDDIVWMAFLTSILPGR